MTKTNKVNIDDLLVSESNYLNRDSVMQELAENIMNLEYVDSLLKSITLRENKGLDDENLSDVLFMREELVARIEQLEINLGFRKDSKIVEKNLQK